MEHYSDKARLIPIYDYLGVVADKIEVWIKSPFNPSERTESFKIHTKNNVWYDHSIGKGGGIIDLVMMLNNCSFSSALSILSNNQFKPINKPLINTDNTDTDTQIDKKEFIINKIQDLQNKILVKYLHKRKINIDIASKYLKEIYYKNNSKNYFALAFENDSKNYEVRNSYFKGCVGSKNITTIKGIGNKELSIFEGFIDFLSALTYYKINEFKSDIIILNSIANKSKIVTILSSNEYKKIYLFLDNDKAGIDTKRELYNFNHNCIDCSNIYKLHKDFNEMLISEKLELSY